MPPIHCPPLNAPYPLSPSQCPPLEPSVPATCTHAGHLHCATGTRRSTGQQCITRQIFRHRLKQHSQQPPLNPPLVPLLGRMQVYGATLRHEAEQVVQWCAEECEGDLQRLREAVCEREGQREALLAVLRQAGKGGNEVKGREAQPYQQVGEEVDGRLFLRRDAQITGLSPGRLSGGSMREEEEGYRLGSQERDASSLLLDLQRNARGDVQWEAAGSAGESPGRVGVCTHGGGRHACSALQPLSHQAIALTSLSSLALPPNQFHTAAGGTGESPGRVGVCTHGRCVEWVSANGGGGGALKGAQGRACGCGCTADGAKGHAAQLTAAGYSVTTPAEGGCRNGGLSGAVRGHGGCGVAGAHLHLKSTSLPLFSSPSLYHGTQMVRRGMQPNAQQLAIVLRRLQRGDAGVEAYLGLCAALADVGLLEPTLVFLYVDLLRLCILRML
ncbi:unnamed protein product [Closterium sp. NIES-54]